MTNRTILYLTAGAFAFGSFLLIDAQAQQRNVGVQAGMVYLWQDFNEGETVIGNNNWLAFEGSDDSVVNVHGPSGDWAGGKMAQLNNVSDPWRSAIPRREPLPGDTGTPWLSNSFTVTMYSGGSGVATTRAFPLLADPSGFADIPFLFGIENSAWNLRNPDPGGSRISGESNINPNSFYNVTLGWTDEVNGERDIKMWAYDHTAQQDLGVVLEATVSAAFFGPDSSEWVGFGFRSQTPDQDSSLTSSGVAEFGVAAIPEPGTYALWGGAMALLSVAFLRYRRQQLQASVGR